MVLIGGLVCGTCVRPRELNLDYKKGAESLYQKDFKPHASYKAVPRMGSDFFGGYGFCQSEGIYKNETKLTHSICFFRE